MGALNVVLITWGGVFNFPNGQMLFLKKMVMETHPVISSSEGIQ